MKLEQNPEIAEVIERLENRGFQVYIVGGAVRDALLGIKSKDIDLSTNATLEEIREVFKEDKIVDYKKGHTLGVVLNSVYFEVSTFIGKTIAEDLSNRDFSINSMAYHLKEGFIDPYHGQRDLNDHILRSIKSPKEIIEDDPIRILRAIRFEATLGMKPTEELKKCVLTLYPQLERVNPERYVKEIERILLVEESSKYIREYFPVFAQIFPSLKDTYQFNQHTRWHHLDVFEHIMTVLDHTKPNLVSRYAALFHDIEKPKVYTIDDEGNGHFYNHYSYSAITAEKELSKMRYGKEFIKRVYQLVFYHDLRLEPDKRKIAKFLKDFKTQDLDLLFDLKRADIIGQNPELIYRLKEIDELEELTNEIIKNKENITLKDLNIKGNHLQFLGFKNEEIGLVLNQILSLVIDGKLKNDKEQLLEYAQKIKK